MSEPERATRPGRPVLHHVALGARDVERVAAFYRDVIGLPEIRRQLLPNGAVRSIWLDAGGPVLMIERTAQPSRPVEGVGPGPFLLAFAAGARGPDGWVESLAAAGVTVESRTERTIYFRDPEGNRVGLSGYDFGGDNDITV